MCLRNTHANPARIKQETKNKSNSPRTRTSPQEQEQALKNQDQDPNTSTNTQDLPCFGALEEGNTSTAALA